MTLMNVDFCQYRNDVCLVTASFSEMPWLTVLHVKNFSIQSSLHKRELYASV